MTTHKEIRTEIKKIVNDLYPDICVKLSIYNKTENNNKNETVIEKYLESLSLLSKNEYKHLDTKTKAQWRISKRELFISFCNWIKENNVKPKKISKKIFGIIMSRKCGVVQNKGIKYYTCQLK